VKILILDYQVYRKASTVGSSIALDFNYPVECLEHFNLDVLVGTCVELMYRLLALINDQMHQTRGDVRLIFSISDDGKH